MAAAMCGLPRAAMAADMPVDYGKDAAWICRPGQEGVCITGLDAMEVDAKGKRTPQAFAPAKAPPIDCFYIYPTASLERTRYSDLALTPELAKTALGQAGRLTSRCRLFAPLYRQLTIAGLHQDLEAGGHGPGWTNSPYADVLAAWRWYMANANKGRGVVLIGHSQGTILLHRLMAEEIDGKADQAHLVAAFLAGDPSLPVPKGRVVGGAFQHVPLCTQAAETGCVYVWGSYLADDDSTDRRFGHSPGAGLVGGCANPAAPSGGAGPLKAYLRKPSMAPDGDPPFVEVEGQLSGQCIADEQGNVLRVTILPSVFAELLHAALHGHRTGWGLHALDLNLEQGNILDALSAETGAWIRTH